MGTMPEKKTLTVQRVLALVIAYICLLYTSMADFPDMKFILIGDDGQKDPTTYATIARRYPGRVLAIGIRQLSPREVAGNLGTVAGRAATQPIPVTDVPVFTGTTGSNLMRTMLPFLKQQLGV